MVLMFINKKLYKLQIKCPFVRVVQLLCYNLSVDRFFIGEWRDKCADCGYCLIYIQPNKWHSATICVWVFGQWVSPNKGHPAAICLHDVWSTYIRPKKGRQMNIKMLTNKGWLLNARELIKYYGMGIWHQFTPSTHPNIEYFSYIWCVHTNSNQGSRQFGLTLHLADQCPFFQASPVLHQAPLQHILLFVSRLEVS